MDEEASFVVGFDDGVFAAGLESPQFGRVLFDGPGDALLVCGEQLKILRLSDPGAALGEGGVDFRVGGIGIGVLLKAEGEDRIFEGAGAIEAPVVLGDGLGEVGFRAPRGASSSRMASQCFWKAA